MNPFDFDLADPTASESMPLSFPLVQWRNGDPKLRKYAGSMGFVGGFFFPYDACGEGTVIPGWKPESFVSQEGNKEIEGLHAPEAFITIIRSRRRWQTRDGNQTILRPWHGYEAGMQGKMQCVGFVKGFEGPVQFSFSGTTITWLSECLRDFWSRVMVGIVNRQAPKGSAGLPIYSLYMPIKAGAHIPAGKGAKTRDITPPVLDLPKALSVEYARDLYIGRDLLLQSQELFHELEGWAHEWDVFDNRTSAARAYLNSSPEEFPGKPPAIEEFLPPDNSEPMDYTPDF